METVKKRYLLQGLCCGVCAANIEKEVGELPGVASSRMDLMSQTLSVELQEPQRADGLLEDVKTVVKRHEAEVAVSEKEMAAPEKRILYLTGLGCASCAHKIAAAVGGLSGVRGASIDFVTGKLTVEAVDEAMIPRILRESARIAGEIEPGVTVSLQKPGDKKDKPSLLGELRSRWPILLGAVLFGLGLVFGQPWWLRFLLLLAAYLLIGGEVLLRAGKNILRGRVFDENFLMSLATLGAFAIGEYPEGVAVMLFYQVGEYFQQRAVGRSRASIAGLMDVRPDYANLLEDGADRRVSPEEVGVGDIIVVRPGEKIPLDGVVLTGTSALDTSALTGEALPREIGEGSDVLSGCVNLSGVLTVQVSKVYGESTVAKILYLVENASAKKAKAEQFITKFARVYTPVVVIAAALLGIVPPLVLPGAVFSDWIYRALAFLMVSCPCALVISIPLSFFGGIGGASRQGVLIKGGSYLEALAAVDTVVFDKTGTLTKGTFAVTDILPAGDASKEELLTLAAAAESYSTHPIARSVVKAGGEIDKSRLSDYREIAGRGVRVLFDGVPLLGGSLRLMEDAGISVPGTAPAIGTAVHVALGGTYKGYLLIADEAKPDSAEAIAALKKAGVRRIVMLTGDNKAAAEAVAAKLGITDVYSDLLPADKVEKLEELERTKAPKGVLAFVGDGINDAPVLARADVGLAMGGLGSDAAIEAADVVLMTDEPSKVALAIRIARRAMGIVRQNVVFSLAVKGIILILSAVGLSTMWGAVFGDVGVALIAVLNAMRALKAPKA